jgi:hypothetical protein
MRAQVGGGQEHDRFRFGRADDRRRQRMLARRFDGDGEPKQLRPSETVEALEIGQLGSARVSVPVLSNATARTPASASR